MWRREELSLPWNQSMIPIRPSSEWMNLRRNEGNAMKSAAAVVNRALRIAKIPRRIPKEIPILVRIWHEDEVWNLSAFDLPIVVFDRDLEQARIYFGEAICSHFFTLKERGKLKETATELLKIAQKRGFYEQRLQPRQLVERLDYSVQSHSLCSAVG
jgi:hypothetical protein